VKLFSALLTAACFASTASLAKGVSSEIANEAQAREAFNARQFNDACNYFARVAFGVRGHSLAASCFSYWAESDPAHWDDVVKEWEKAKDACVVKECIDQTERYRRDAAQVVEARDHGADVERDNTLQNAQLAVLEKQVAESQARVDDWEKAVVGPCADLEPDQCKTKLEEMQSQLNRLREDNKKLRADLAKKTTDLKKVQDQLRDSQKQVLELRQRLYRYEFGNTK
jgi:hypothetical protein